MRAALTAVLLLLLLPAAALAQAPVATGADERQPQAETTVPAAQPRPVHAIAMHGDPKYPPDFAHFDYVNPDSPKGGTLRLAAQGAYDSFNAYIPKGEAAAISGVYDPLLVSSADEPFSEYGLLAESVTVPEDRSWVEFTLRPEARWHDGKPVTVEDVIWSLNTLRTQGEPTYRFYYAGIAKSEKVGERTVRFTFKT